MSDESIGSQCGIAETNPQARSAPCGQISSIFRSQFSTSYTDVIKQLDLSLAPLQVVSHNSDSAALTHAEMPSRTAIRTMRRVAITVAVRQQMPTYRDRGGARGHRLRVNAADHICAASWSPGCDAGPF